MVAPVACRRHQRNELGITFGVQHGVEAIDATPCNSVELIIGLRKWGSAR